MRLLKRLETLVKKLRQSVLIDPLLRSRFVRREIGKAFPPAIYADPDSFTLVCRRCGDHDILFDPKDGVIGLAIVQSGGWKRQQFAAIVSALEAEGLVKDRVFLDVGANIGTQSVYALLSGAFSRTIAMEPYKPHARCIRLNAVLNGMEDRIDVVEMAAGGGPGNLELSLHPSNGGAHSLMRAYEATPKESVEVVAVDAMIERMGLRPDQIGLIWVDVEGFEIEAIAGMSSLLEAGVPLCLEFNPADYGPAAAQDFFSRISRHYRKVAVVTGERVEFQPVVNVACPTTFTDIVFI